MASVKGGSQPAKVVHSGYHARGSAPVSSYDAATDTLTVSMPARSEPAGGHTMEQGFGDVLFRRENDTQCLPP